MPRNTRNVWIDARIDGRSTTMEGGPASRDGGLSAVILQRQNGGIGDERVRVATFATGGGTIRTEVTVDTERRHPAPGLMLTTHRDRPGATVTLDLYGLAEAVAYDPPNGPSTQAVLTFTDDEHRDAFLAWLPAFRAAQESAEVSA